MEDNEVYIINTCIVCLFVLFIAITISIAVNYKTEIEGTIECNSGDLDFDFNGEWTEEEILGFGGKRIIEEKLKPLNLSIAGIDGLNCKATYEFKGNINRLEKLLAGLG